MGTLITLSDEEWRPFEDSDGVSVLSTSAKRAVCHSVGANGYPVLLTQLASDPAHPFTAGQMVVTLDTVVVKGGHTRDIAHSENYPRGEIFDFPDEVEVGHTVHSGGFYLATDREPLEWKIEVGTTLTPSQSYWMTIELFEPDFTAIDGDDRTDVAMTIDPDTEAATPANIAVTDATSTPAGSRGGVILRKTLTAAQYGHLTPVDGDGNRTHKKIGLTIAAAATTPVITYSAYDEAHPTREQAEYLLRNGQTIGLQAPATGAWYARATRHVKVGPTKIYVGD